MKHHILLGLAFALASLQGSLHKATADAGQTTTQTTQTTTYTDKDVTSTSTVDPTQPDLAPVAPNWVGAELPSPIGVANGNPTMSLPFALPPARHGYTPSLVAQYTGSSQNSWLGQGWYMDVSMIERDTSSGVPTYTTADNFVFVDSSGGRQELVRMGSLGLGTEYRLRRDDADIRFILQTDGTWRLQYRNGVTEYLSASVYTGSNILTNVFQWRLRRAINAEGDVIDYLSTGGGTYRVPRLSEIRYGGSVGAGGGLASALRLPHPFRVILYREGAGSAPSSLNGLDRSILGCGRVRRGRIDYRSGGPLINRDGEMELLRGIAVEAAGPATSDGTIYNYAIRRSQYWVFRYNFDRVGCFDPENLWPLLERVESAHDDATGRTASDPWVSFEYHGWNRDLQETPVAMRNAVPADWVEGVSYDVDLDGIVDVTSADCSQWMKRAFDGSLDAPRAWPSGVPPTCVRAVPIGRGYISASGQPNEFAAGLELVGGTALGDTNLDGFADRIGSNNDGLYIEESRPDGSVQYLSASDYPWRGQWGSYLASPNRDWADERTNMVAKHSSILCEFDEPRASTSTYTVNYDSSGNPVIPPYTYTQTNYSAVLKNTMGMIESTSEMGFIADFTGDGLPDRLTTYDAPTGTRTASRLALYPFVRTGGAPGWAAAQKWYERLPITGEGPQPLVPSPNRSFVFGSCASYAQNAEAIVSDTAVDMNGDGLLDLVSTLPRAFRGPSTPNQYRQLSFLSGAKTFFNFGRGFTAAAPATWSTPAQSAPVTLGRNYEHTRYGWITKEVVQDVNGDGLADLLSVGTNSGAGWVRYNLGGYFSERTPFGPSSWVGFTRVADLNGDGKVDFAALHADGHTGLWTDNPATSAPAGKLRAMNAQNGVRVELQWRALSSLTRARSGGMWVVSQRTVTGADEQQNTRYEYGASVWLADALARNKRTTFRGFETVTEYGPMGKLYIDYEFSAGVGFSGAPRVIQRWSASQPEALLSQTTYEYELQTRSGTERLLTRRVTNGIYTPTLTGNKVVRMEYVPNTTLPSAIYRDGFADDPSDDSVTRTTWIYNSGLGEAYYGAAVSSQSVEGNGAVLRHTRYTYDGGTYSVGRVTSASTLVQSANPLFGITETRATTQYTYGTYGQLLSVRSPLGRVSSYCWDGHAMYPVLETRPDATRVATVYSYITGAPIQQSGPVGIAPPAKGEVCRQYPATVSWANRGSPSSVVLPGTPQARPAVVADAAPANVLLRTQDAAVVSDAALRSWAQDDVFAIGTSVLYDPSDAYSRERMTPAAPRTMEANMVGVSVSSALTLGSVLSAASRPTSYSSPTWFADYNAAERRTTYYRSTRRALDNTYNLVPASWSTAFPGDANTWGSQQSGTAIGAGIERRTEALLDAFGRVVYTAALDNTRAGTALDRVETTQTYANGAPWTSTQTGVDSERLDVITRVAARDSLGRVTLTRQDDGTEWRTEYRLARTTTGATREEARAYWPDGTLKSTSLYDGLGRLRRSIAGTGKSALFTSYEYDAASQLTSVTQPDGTVTYYGYDGRGKLASWTRYAHASSVGLSAAAFCTFTYDLDGAVLWTTDSNWATTRNEYDPTTGQRTAMRVPAIAAGASAPPAYGDVVYVWVNDYRNGGLGQLSSVTMGGRTVSYQYDGLGRKTRESHTENFAMGGSQLNDSYAFGWEWDDYGALLAQTWEINPGIVQRVAYTHDRNGRTEAMTESGRELARIAYNLAGLPARVSDLFGGIEVHSYDAMGRATDLLVEMNNGLPRYQQNATYDARGNMDTLRTELGDGNVYGWTMGYDGYNRLTSVIEDSKSNGYRYQAEYATTQIARTTEAFADGSNLALRYAYSSRDPAAVETIINEALSTAHLTIGYDAFGTMNARTLQGVEQRLVIDPLGRLTGSRYGSYAYDVFGLQTHVFNKKTGRLEARVAGLLNIDYVSDGSSWVRDTVDRVVGRLTISGDGSVRITHADLRNNTALVRSSTEVRRTQWSPFGTILRQIEASDASLSDPSLVTVNGARRDQSGLELIQMGARAFDPWTKRFASIDPLIVGGLARFDAIGNDPYNANNDNPFTYSDPTGFQPCDNLNPACPGSNNLAGAGLGFAGVAIQGIGDAIGRGICSLFGCSNASAPASRPAINVSPSPSASQVMEQARTQAAATAQAFRNVNPPTPQGLLQRAWSGLSRGYENSIEVTSRAIQRFEQAPGYAAAEAIEAAGDHVWGGAQWMFFNGTPLGHALQQASGVLGIDTETPGTRQIRELFWEETRDDVRSAVYRTTDGAMTAYDVYQGARGLAHLGNMARGIVRARMRPAPVAAETMTTNLVAEAAAAERCPGGLCGGAGECFLAGTPVLTDEDETKAIEELRVGERVRTLNEAPCAASDLPSRRLVRIKVELDKPEDHFSIELLRDEEWLSAHGVTKPGDLLWLDIPELGVTGDAQVIGLDTEPSIASGPGCVVTATYSHLNHEVRALAFESRSELIYTTASHPFFSLDRDQWVVADELLPGERLQTLKGEEVLEARQKLPGVHPVYNLEVDTAHTYAVGQQQLWVHNACAWHVHNPAQPDIMSKGLHFEAPNRVELRIRPNGRGSVTFESVFGGSSSEIQAAITAAETRFATNASWRAEILRNAQTARGAIAGHFDSNPAMRGAGLRQHGRDVRRIVQDLRDPP